MLTKRELLERIDKMCTWINTPDVSHSNIEKIVILLREITLRLPDLEFDKQPR